jgi:hypothetical protein
MKTRNLKIEATGDFALGKVKPKIRLTGHWLEHAGFWPGQRVTVQIVEPGILVLRLLGLSENFATPCAGSPDVLQGSPATAGGLWQGDLALGQTNLPQHGAKPVRNEIRGQQGDRQDYHAGEQLAKSEQKP